jgi:Cu/Zn superoxide dismutase
MSNGVVPSRFGRIGVASIILAVVLLVSPLLSVSAQRGGHWLQVPIQATSGAVLGTATFAPALSGGVMIQMHVQGFDPVAGSHRIAIASVGSCIPPFAVCAAYEVVVLPDMQFNADGSGDYTTVATNLTMDWFRQGYGTSIVIHADSGATSAIIGCGVISGSDKMRPGPHPQPQPKPKPQPQPKPQPKPAPVIGHYRVTAALGLRLRSGPGLGYATRRIVPRGTILEDLNAEQWNGGILWAKVRAGGANYWCAKTYLQSY